MPTTYRATLTNVGASQVADAIAQGTTLTWAKMALGDGNGSAVTVDASRTSLVNEQYRAPLNDLVRDSANPNTIVGTLVVPPETGGWTIREFGIYDNAATPNLVAYGETPEIEKPASSASAGINLRLRFRLVVSADANITLSPDSNEAYATIEYVKDNAVKSLSVSGRTITYTMGDGDTHTLTTQDTTYDVATQSANGLMSKTDKGIVDNLPQTYYPLSGGTLNGNQIMFTGSSPYITPNSTEKYLRLFNYSFAGGGSLYLSGKDFSDSPGQFRLNAHDGTNYKTLIGKPDGSLTWGGQDVIYQHPTYTARTGKPASNATPGFGDTVTVSQIKSDGTGHVTAATDRTITIPNSVATISAAGLMSATDKSKLDGITAGAEPNQNAFSAVKVNNTSVSADTKTDTLTLNGGSGITLTTDATSDKITIAVTSNTFYPITGGTIQGNSIEFTGDSPNIGPNTTNKYLRLFNTSFIGGASLYLIGKDIPGDDLVGLNEAGCFRLNAHNGTNYSSLIGKPDGSLTWNNHNVLTDAVSYAKVADLPSLYTSINFSSVSVSNATYTNLGSFTPSKTGKWLIMINVSIDANATGYRRLVIANSATGNYPDRFRNIQTDGTTANSTLLQLSWLSNFTSISTVYFNVYQTSGNALNASGGYRAYYLGG